MSLFRYTLLVLVCIGGIAGCGKSTGLTDAGESGDRPYCGRSGADTDMKNSLHELGNLASLSLQLASGHVNEAQEDIGSSIATLVLVLESRKSRNPSAGADDASNIQQRINAMLRVVAAANHRVPIAHVNSDAKIMAILSGAIADNPEHYEGLLKRSDGWDRGIR
jgi:hypothetical protein